MIYTTFDEIEYNGIISNINITPQLFHLRQSSPFSSNHPIKWDYILDKIKLEATLALLSVMPKEKNIVSLLALHTVVRYLGVLRPNHQQLAREMIDTTFAYLSGQIDKDTCRTTLKKCYNKFNVNIDVESEGRREYAYFIDGIMKPLLYLYYPAEQIERLQMIQGYKGLAAGKVRTATFEEWKTERDWQVSTLLELLEDPAKRLPLEPPTTPYSTHLENRLKQAEILVANLKDDFEKFKSQPN